MKRTNSDACQHATRQPGTFVLKGAPCGFTIHRSENTKQKRLVALDNQFVLDEFCLGTRGVRTDD